jgi:hypothetical protein
VRLLPTPHTITASPSRVHCILTFMEATGRRTATFGDLRRCDSNFPIAYGSTQVMFRAGTKPTGIVAISFIDLISTTETLFDCSFAT